MNTLILRRDLGKQAYRLKGRFRIGAYPSERALEIGKFEAAEMFVRDMAKQDYEYVDRYGFRLNGPFPHVETVHLPKRRQQERWNDSAKGLFASVQAGNFKRLAGDGGDVRPVPHISETDDWDYELSGVFVHETLIAQTADEHEELEELKW